MVEFQRCRKGPVVNTGGLVYPRGSNRLKFGLSAPTGPSPTVLRPQDPTETGRCQKWCLRRKHGWPNRYSAPSPGTRHSPQTPRAMPRRARSSALDPRPGKHMPTCGIEPATFRMESQRATAKPPRAPYLRGDIYTKDLRRRSTYVWHARQRLFREVVECLQTIWVHKTRLDTRPIPVADGWARAEMRVFTLSNSITMTRRTDQRTNGPTDQRTNGRTKPLIE